MWSSEVLLPWFSRNVVDLTEAWKQHHSALRAAYPRANVGACVVEFWAGPGMDSGTTPGTRLCHLCVRLLESFPWLDVEKEEF